MLFRRIASHVRDQNWTAVFIDFVIVVVGVFIGLQVANWNEAKQREAEAERLLETLVVDLAEVREVLVWQQERYTLYIDTLDDLMDALESDAPVSEAFAGESLTTILNFHLPPDLPLSFQDMLSAGRLDRLQSSAVRDGLRDYAAQVSLTQRATGLLSQSFLDALDRMRPYIGFERPDELSEAFDALRVDRVDIEGLRETGIGLTALTQLYQGHRNMLSIVAQLIVDLDTAQQTITGGSAD